MHGSLPLMRFESIGRKKRHSNPSDSLTSITPRLWDKVICIYTLLLYHSDHFTEICRLSFLLFLRISPFLLSKVVSLYSNFQSLVTDHAARLCTFSKSSWMVEDPD